MSCTLRSTSPLLVVKWDAVARILNKTLDPERATIDDLIDRGNEDSILLPWNLVHLALQHGFRQLGPSKAKELRIAFARGDIAIAERMIPILGHDSRPIFAGELFTPPVYLAHGVPAPYRMCPRYVKFDRWAVRLEFEIGDDVDDLALRTAVGYAGTRIGIGHGNQVHNGLFGRFAARHWATAIETSNITIAKPANALFAP